VGVVAPFDYIQLLWASLIGFSIWGEVPEPVTMAGALVVAGSGGYILWREIRAARMTRSASS
jgi:drug/metabolite transporter (DMT)-like permease